MSPLIYIFENMKEEAIGKIDSNNVCWDGWFDFGFPHYRQNSRQAPLHECSRYMLLHLPREFSHESGGVGTLFAFQYEIFIAPFMNLLYVMMTGALGKAFLLPRGALPTFYLERQHLPYSSSRNDKYYYTLSIYTSLL